MQIQFYKESVLLTFRKDNAFAIYYASYTWSRSENVYWSFVCTFTMIIRSSIFYCNRFLVDLNIMSRWLAHFTANVCNRCSLISFNAVKFYIFLMHLIIFPHIFEPWLRERGACMLEHSTNSVHIINTFKKQIEWRISMHPDYVPKRIPLSLFFF